MYARKLNSFKVVLNLAWSFKRRSWPKQLLIDWQITIDLYAKVTFNNVGIDCRNDYFDYDTIHH